MKRGASSSVALARRPSCVALALALGFSCLTACSAGKAVQPADPNADGGSVPVPPDGVAMNGVVKEFAFEEARQRFDPLGGVSVCVHGHEEVPCVRTNTEGTFSLRGVPKDDDVLLSFTKLGYVSGLRQVVSREEDYDILAETVLGSVDDAVSQAVAMGVTEEGQLSPGGVIQFFGVTPGDGVLQVAMLSDYSVTLADAEGNPVECDVGEGPAPCKPIYLGASGFPDAALTSASALGVGLFGVLPAGEYLLSYTHPAFGCTTHLRESGFEAPAANSVRVAVVPGFITSQVGMVCQPE